MCRCAHLGVQPARGAGEPQPEPGAGHLLHQPGGGQGHGQQRHRQQPQQAYGRDGHSASTVQVQQHLRCTYLMLLGSDSDVITIMV